MRKTSRKSAMLIAGAAAGLGLMAGAHGATYSWSSADVSGDWTSGSNWGGSAPTSATTNDLVFVQAGADQFAQDVNSSTNFYFNSLTFTTDIASPYTLTNSAKVGTTSATVWPTAGILYAIPDGATNPSITSSSSQNITLTAWMRTASTGGTMNINVTGAGKLSLDLREATITKDGTGTLELTTTGGTGGLGGLTLNDGMVVSLGTLNSGRLFKNNIVVGDGVGAAGSAVLRRLQTSDGTPTLTINSDGQLQMDNTQNSTYTLATTMANGASVTAGGTSGIFWAKSLTVPATSTAKVTIERAGVIGSWDIADGLDASGIDAQVTDFYATTSSAVLTKSANGTLKIANAFTGTSVYRGSIDVTGGRLILGGGIGSYVTKPTNQDYHLRVGNSTSGQTTTLTIGSTTNGFAATVGITNGLDDQINAGGVLEIGENSVGTVTVTGNTIGRSLVFSGGTLKMQLGGTTAGSQYDVLKLTTNNPALTLTNSAMLDVSFVGAFTPSLSDMFFIVDNTASTVTGTFANATDGGKILLGNGWRADISYVGNLAGLSTSGGNDIVLYNMEAVPEPASMSLLGIGTLGLLGRRRPRSHSAGRSR